MDGNVRLAVESVAVLGADAGTISLEYGFRLDTDNYAYALRLNPDWGDYNFYLYCYVRECPFSPYAR